MSKKLTIPLKHATKEAVHPAFVVPILRNRWFILARAGWIGVVLLHLGLFAVSLLPYFAALQTVCGAAPCPPWQLTPENARALGDWGLSANVYAIYMLALQVIFTMVFWVIAAVLFWRKSAEWLTLFVSLTLVLVGTHSPSASQVLFEVYPTLALLGEFSASLGWASFFLIFFYLFPDGRFVPRWTRLLAAGWYALNLPATLSLERFFPDSPLNYDQWHPLLTTMAVLGLYGSGVVAQIYRYRHVSNPVQRQQTKWVVFAMTWAVIGFLGLILPGVIFPALALPTFPQVLFSPVGATVVTLSFLPMPLVIGIAILRYRLWDIDLLINRTLVYGSLTASVVGLYVLVVGGLSVLFQTGGNLLISLLATAVVAVIFAPLRDRLQRGVNRLLYGQRDEPYTVLSRLGQRLEATLAPDAILPTVVATVKEALKLPYAAIILDQEGHSVEVAAAESVMPNPLCLPLSYQGETIGQLILAPRASGETFTPAERRLLNDLAHQAGVAAAAVRLTADLQRSREKLVTAREEERRRLRRDLHDGLGPALAAHTLKIGSARALIARDPPAADVLLAELETDIQTALADIRRLVYNLRPPSLDELGLIGAIRESAAQYGWFGERQINGNDVHRLHIILVAPERLLLPAAVEVAAYRIVQEALTNVVRHAQAQTCHIHLRLDEMLQLEITDDGVGLPPERRAGVGLVSMRERAQELGGTCQIETAPTGGVRIVACLPLPKKEELLGTQEN